MTNEEMERTMQFILDHQAKNTVAIDLLGEKVSALTRDVSALQEVTRTHGQILDRMSHMIVGLAEAQARTAEAQARTDQQIAVMSSKVEAVSDRLDAFIVVVERYITEGRNGRDSA
ncbi:MAG: hypothetical protein ACKV2V_18725 [Blastocatellia bacterium]